MWGLGALRDGAAGLVKQGAGAVKHGVVAGAKLLENLDENFEDGEEKLSRGSDSGSDLEGEEEKEEEEEGGYGLDERGGASEGNDLPDTWRRQEGDGEAHAAALGDGETQGIKWDVHDEPPTEGNLDDAFGLDPTSDEFQAVKREMERLSRNYASQVERKDKEVRKLRREVRRARKQADEMQPQLRQLVDELQASKAEVSDAEEQLLSAKEAVREAVAVHNEDVEALQEQLGRERAEADMEKEGLRQTVQMLQREMGEQHASLSEANQRLEQAARRAAESEARSTALTSEAEELRARLSVAAAAATAARADGGDASVTTPSAQRHYAVIDGRNDSSRSSSSPPTTTPTTIEQDPVSSSSTPLPLLPSSGPEDLEDERQEKRQTELREQLLLTESLLAEERARSQELQLDVEALVSRVASAENAGEEAMKAAATEASRAAESREGLESAKAELFGLRGRMAEWEEESARVAELKGKLETTRDALDEARVSAGEAEAAAERRLREFEVRLSEAVLERDQLVQESESLRQQVASGLAEKEEQEAVSEKLVATKAQHESAMEEAASWAETAQLETASVREALHEITGPLKKAEKELKDKVAVSEELEAALAMERDRSSALAERLVQQEAALSRLESKADSVESERASLAVTLGAVQGERDAIRATAADDAERLAAELTARKQDLHDLQARMEAAEARVVAQQQQQHIKNSETVETAATEAAGEMPSMVTENQTAAAAAVAAAAVVAQGVPFTELQTALRAEYHESYDVVLSGLRRDLEDSERARQSAEAALAKTKAEVDATPERGVDVDSAAPTPAHDDNAAAVAAAAREQELERWVDRAACLEKEAELSGEALREAEEAMAAAVARAEAEKLEAVETAVRAAEEAAEASRARARADAGEELEAAREALRSTEEELVGSREDATTALSAADAARAGLAARIEELELEARQGAAVLEAETGRAEAAVVMAGELRAALESTGRESATEGAAAREEAGELRRQLDCSLKALAETEATASTEHAESVETLSRLATAEKHLTETVRSLEAANEAAAKAAAEAATREASTRESSEVASAEREARAAAQQADAAASFSAELDAVRSRTAQEATALREDLASTRALLSDAEAARARAEEETATARDELEVAVAETAAELERGRARAEDATAVLRRQISTLRHQVEAAEAAMGDMDAERARVEAEKAGLRAEAAELAAAASARAREEAVEEAREAHARAQERLRRELMQEWTAVLEEERGAGGVRVAEMEREVATLRARLSKANEDHAQALKDTSQRAALSLSEAEGAAQVATWETKSLHAEVETLRKRSRELSSSLAEARERESATKREARDVVTAELQSLREALKVAEAGQKQAEDGLARAKDKKKRDLQELRRLNQRMMELQQSRREEAQQLGSTVAELRVKIAALEKNKAQQGDALQQALEERDDLRQHPSALAKNNDGVDAGDANASDNATRTQDVVVGKTLDLPPSPPRHKRDLADAATVATQTSGVLHHGNAETELPRKTDGVVGDAAGAERGEREDGKEVALLRKVAEKLQREVEGLKSDLQEALAGQEEADDARETLAAALTRANARIAELTSKTASLTRARAAMVSQIRALEEQVNSTALAKSGSNQDASTSAKEGASEDSSVSLLAERSASLTDATPMRQRHRQPSWSPDLEDGGVRGRGDDDAGNDDDKMQAKPGDLVKSLLIACASNPVWAAATEGRPGLVNWLHQQPPQTLWTVAMTYLGFLHLLAFYKTVTC